MKSLIGCPFRKSMILIALVGYSILCQAQNWQKVDLGGEFDQVYFTKIHFINDSEGLIIGQNGTIVKTNDGGFNWSNIQSGVSHYLFDITFANEKIGYINGLKTTDGGNTWIAQSSTTNFKFIYAINENHLIANFETGANNYQESFDGGDTWNSVSIPSLPDIDLYAYTPNGYSFIDEQNGYLSLDKGIIAGADTLRLLKTNNSGNSWTPISIPLPDPPPVFGFNGFYGIDFPSLDIGLLLHSEGVLKTTNGGITFSEIIPNDRPEFWAPEAIYAASTDHYLMAGFKPFITDSVVSMYETFDGGINWSKALISPGNEYLSDMFCTSINCFATGGALYRKFDTTATSTKETDKFEINIFPNPSMDFIQIESNSSIIEEVIIYDIYGKLYKKLSSSLNRINVSDLPCGLYILNIRFEGNKSTFKFEKL